MYDKIERSNTATTKGSIFDVAFRRGMKPEEVLADADILIIFDDSSSMDESLGGRTRYDFAVDALKKLQEAHEGRIVLINFSSTADIYLGGIPPRPNGNTRLDLALELAKEFDDMGMKKIVIITDGEPNGPTDVEQLCIDIAKTFKTPIDTIFIGEDYMVQAMKFLEALTTGRALGHVDVENLAEKVTKLLTT